ncbi:MAG: Panacea domain-containing protein [Verrucomicrobiota bacterium]|nr:Panacea domain-containing protein [Verrucomicrobiota bacterium]
MSARIRFNERKATQAAAHLLRLRGGPMSYLKLIKLLYLADREALLRWGRPISTDRYVSMDRGPVLSRVLDLTTNGEDPGTPSIWVSSITEPRNYEVELKGDAGDDELSEAEIQLLDQVFAQHGKMSRWDLVKLTHALPEWIDPRGSAIEITYRDILKAGGKSDLEIAAVEEELAELAETDLLLAAR